MNSPTAWSPFSPTHPADSRHRESSQRAVGDRYSPRMLSPIFESRLDDLLAAWRHHNDLRTQGAAIPDLAAARAALDRSRDAAYRVRRALNPEPAEAEEALATAHCSWIDDTVFLFAADARWDGSTPQLKCVCGERVTPPTARSEARQAF